MGVLDDLERLELAVSLLRREARVSIVHHQTGVSRAKLRTLHREIHGRSAPSGQIAMLGGATIQTRAQQLHAGLFAALYARYGGPAMTHKLDIRALIAAYDLYLFLVPQGPQVDFNAAWVIARDCASAPPSFAPAAPARCVIWSPAPVGWRRPALFVRYTPAAAGSRCLPGYLPRSR